MEIGYLFIKSLSSGVITFEEILWLTKSLSNFTRCEKATALRLGRLIDSGQIQLGCRI